MPNIRFSYTPTVFKTRSVLGAWCLGLRNLAQFLKLRAGKWSFFGLILNVENGQKFPDIVSVKHGIWKFWKFPDSKIQNIPRNFFHSFKSVLHMKLSQIS